MRVIESSLDLSDSEIDYILSNEKIMSSNNKNKLMCLLFLSPSTRTRLSFIKALMEIGIQHVDIRSSDLRLFEGESINDTALAISQYADYVGLRVVGAWNNQKNNYSMPAYPLGNQIFNEFSKALNKPLVNLECDRFHPCQGLADLLTIKNIFGDYENKNIVLSWAYSPTALRVPAVTIESLLIFSRFIKNITLVHPPEFYVEDKYIDIAKNNLKQIDGELEITSNRDTAYKDADVIYARNWTSINVHKHGIESEIKVHDKYKNWIIDKDIVNNSKKTYYMHCMPLHREFEVSSSVVDGDKSLVNMQLKNRTLVQKNLFHILSGGAI